MVHKQYEIEVKVLIGNKNTLSSLLKRLHEKSVLSSPLTHTTQLNHYFSQGNRRKLLSKLSKYLSIGELKELRQILFSSKTYSLRTRKENEKTIFVVKASTLGNDSDHDIRRREFEVNLPVSLETLDGMILSADYTYQSKWSRERRMYTYKDITLCIDKNAGYGYLAEFEKVIYNKQEIEKTRNQIVSEIKALGLEELPNARLNRMFSYYNKHWREYYQTEKTFIVK